MTGKNRFAGKAGIAVRSPRLSMFFAALLALVMLFSVLFIVLEADHDCCGEGCSICTQIAACENLLNHLALATAALLAADFFSCAVRSITERSDLVFRPLTPILLKVKLSD